MSLTRRRVLAASAVLLATPSIVKAQTWALKVLDRRFQPRVWLGKDLLAHWSARRYDLITIATGVSSWKDTVAAYDVTQATGAAQPVWNAQAFGGAPGVLFDGTDDFLALTLAGQFPAGATPCEMWVLCQQNALPADTGQRFAFSYGSAATTTSRAIIRIVSAGVNLARGNAGDGAAQQTTTGNRNFSSRHVVRLQVGATSSTLTVDNVVMTTTTAVPNTTATRLRIGANPAATAISFWQGVVADALITNPLPPQAAAQLMRGMMQLRNVTG